MKLFYVIQLINKVGERGFVYDSADGIKLIVGGITADVTQFATFELATAFIRHHKLERICKYAYVKDSESLMAEKPVGLVPLASGERMYYIEGEDGRKCFIDSRSRTIYFTNRDVGFCCFKSVEQAEEFLSNYEVPFKYEIKLIASPNGNSPQG